MDTKKMHSNKLFGKSKLFKLCLTLAFPIGVVGGMTATYGIIHAYENGIKNQLVERLGDSYKYCLTTTGGIPITFDMAGDTLQVVFDENFNDEAKKNATFALQHLDDILIDKEVKIYQNGDMPHSNKYISLKVVDEGKLGSSSVGLTQINFNDNTGKLTYPISIEIDEHYVDSYYYEANGEVPSNSVFATIVQHEVGHALGLRDLYYYEEDIQKQEYGKIDSVMASTLLYGTTLYSKVDETNLQKLYCSDALSEPITYNVSYPTQMVVKSVSKNAISKHQNQEDEMTL